MEWFLYILQSLPSGRYYVGVSSNPLRRLEFHNSVEKGHTARYRPWNIVFEKRFPCKQEALAAERRVKQWKSRAMIERIIAGETSI